MGCDKNCNCNENTATATTIGPIFSEFCMIVNYFMYMFFDLNDFISNTHHFLHTIIINMKLILILKELFYTQLICTNDD